MKTLRFRAVGVSFVGLFLLGLAGAVFAEEAVALPEGKVGAAYTHEFRAEGGLAPLKWSVAGGELPPGLSLEEAGKLTGTPATSRREPYEFVIEVTDSGEPPQRFAQSFTLRVEAGALRIVTEARPLRIVESAAGAKPGETGGESRSGSNPAENRETPGGSGKPAGELDPPLVRPPQAGSKKVRARQRLAGPETTESPESAPVEVEGDCKPDEWDCRDRFEASVYVGFAVDTFAGSETQRFLNLDEDSNDKKLRGIGGFDVAYRLTADPGEHGGLDSGPENQWWLFAETVHGVRSADVNCTENERFPTCDNFLKVLQPGAAQEDLFFILRNATSLEAFGGVRWEFYSFGRTTKFPVNAYLKGQIGLASVSKGPDDAADMHHLGLGVISTKGPFQGSYLDAGYGRTDLFATRRRRRFKFDALLTRRITEGISFFAQMFVDGDFGRGSDSVQSYFGFDFDLLRPKDWFKWPVEEKTESK